MSTSTYVSSRPPRGAGNSDVVSGFSHKKEKGWFYHVAEKLNQGAGDPNQEASAAERGFLMVEDGPRKSLWRMPQSEWDAIEQADRDEANNRLKSRSAMNLERTGQTESGDTVKFEETTNRAEVSEGMSAQELVAGMRE